MSSKRKPGFLQGKIHCFFKSESDGFIRSLGGTMQYYFELSDRSGRGKKIPEKGDLVTFLPENHKIRGWRATQWSIVDSQVEVGAS